MRSSACLLLLAASALAQHPVAVGEARAATRLVWIAGVARPVEVRIDFGAAAWRPEYAGEVEAKSECMFPLGAGGWAALHAGAELQFAGRRLPSGIWYLALHRDAEAHWSLAILDATKVCRQGALPGGVDDVKPAMLVPMRLQHGRPACPQLQLELAAAAEPGSATLSLRWGEHELTTAFAVALEPASADVAPPAFQPLDAARARTTASGLRYQQLRPGVGSSPGPKDTVRVHYTGWLTDGTKIDSSLDRKQAGTFRLDQVIQGWTEGVQRMAPGAVFLFEIPPALGYGVRGAGSMIPANATLVFRIELLAIE